MLSSGSRPSAAPGSVGGTVPPAASLLLQMTNTPEHDRTADPIASDSMDVGSVGDAEEEDGFRPSVRRASPLQEEPRLRLPTGAILCMALIGAIGVAALWGALGAMFFRPMWGKVGLLAGLVTFVAAALSTLATVPWIPKPASTAGLVWIAGSALRGGASAALGFLLYSAPPFGWSEDLAKGAAPFLLAVATGYLVVLILEVAVIARHVLRATAS